MIINIDTTDRKRKLINTVFTVKDDLFFNKLFDYVYNPSYESEASFVYQLAYEASMHGDWSPIYVFDSGSIPDETALIKKVSDTLGPKKGFNGMYVLRIETKYAIYYTKFLKEDIEEKEKMFKAYIKNNYEIGIIDNYSYKFKKII